MEAVGLAASVITLIGAASLTSATITRAIGLRGCPQSVLTSLNEVEDFKGILLVAQQALTDLDYDNDQIRRLLARAQTRIEAFDVFLKEKVLRDDVRPQNNEAPRLRKRAKWKEVIGELQSEIDILKQELSSIKQSLTVALTAAQLHFVPRVLLSIQRVSLVHPGNVADSVNQPAVTHDARISAVEQLVSSPSSLFQPRLVPDHLQNRYQLSRDRQSQTNAATACVKLETKAVLQNCQGQCLCQCHVAYEGSSPQWLRGLLGVAFVKSSGLPVFGRRTCNVPRCSNHPARRGSLHVQYMFPMWFFSLAMEVTASWSGLSGVNGTWTLTIPRVLQEPGLYDGVSACLQSRDAENLMRFMTRKGIRSFDIIMIWNSPHTALQLALLYRDTDTISMLLQNGADPSHRDHNGISIAESMYRTSFQDSRSLDPNHDIFEEIRVDVTLPPCHQLVVDGALEQLQICLEQTPETVSFRDHYGFTLLHWAALCSGPETIRAVIDAGADINARSKEGGTVLMWAVSSVQSARVCDVLIQAGAELELEDENRLTALHHTLCVPSPDTATIETLLRAGANVNHIDGFGISVLQQATTLASGKDVELLLSYGADMDAETIRGTRPIECAIMENSHSILEVLLKHHARVNRHWTDRLGTYSWVIYLAATYADVTTMHLLAEARLTDIAMDEHSVFNYWNWLATRPPPVYGESDPPEAMGSAFRALLDSITPREVDHALVRAEESPSGRISVPGAFPVDESEDDDPENRSDDSMNADHDSQRTDDDPDTEDVGLYASDSPTRGSNESHLGNGHTYKQEIRARRSSI